ncbi:MULTISPECIES: chemotaxis protein CheC [unclassified Methanoculleus]|uniref:chemotaxis protein CheC n=1 Tax=unclassified Methanoculleus TaxID=2619537 RepID=UPI0025FC37F2|nr:MULTISPECIES: chemotaxis protein CheC [unclassified Methanoculleus]MCK9319336.1 chemotaxis protein CheC [Methanoculleus sp.]MDD2788297.1 chemotaxis protein CheC [Methanoculleus sp.]MDD3216124.1 chemotaxis protein CheC [Methanoculleus sp.]MDD4315298.1 chemotaxis protein CheC [Methanoculleus sp.]MDD4471861.1 chemotaxis protein CheC [Methanoculleus sp.]
MELDSIQKDALSEFGNIGAAHAATSLSQMLMSPIEMTVPEVQGVDISELHNYISNEISAMVVFQIQGEVTDGGYIVVSMPRETVIRLTNQMLGTTETDREIDEMDRSAAIEIGNIMISAFLDATAELLGIIMLPSPPALAIDMAHAAFASIVAQMVGDVNDVLIFNTVLTGDAPPIYGSIYMLPNAELMQQLSLMLERLMEPFA